MAYQVDDTIAAIASAAGGAARGAVRVSGPRVVECLAACFQAEPGGVELADLRRASRLRGRFHVAAEGRLPAMVIPVDVLLWPSSRSYTRQPSAEIHAPGSAPLLAAILDRLTRLGVRPAAAGEFTLRAFLAGRIDLTQAEAVLGVIDARNRQELDASLDQLAGGLSRPLYAVREQLLWLLAELEAGLDFAEEDIQFIAREELMRRLTDACGVVQATLKQLDARDVPAEVPRVALVGAPNAGKSSLFNALAARFADAAAAEALVSPEPGATRDYLIARLSIDGIACELVDTAGEVADAADEVGRAAQQMAARQRRAADLRLRCVDVREAAAGARVQGSAFRVQGLEHCNDAAAGANETMDEPAVGREIVVLTKADLAPHAALWADAPPAADCPVAATLHCSSRSGAGIGELAVTIHAALAADWADRSHANRATAARCRGSLLAAERALGAAAELSSHGRDELVAAELRAALDGLGEVVGAICADDVLDRVFSRFCIGK
ncbi:MAG: tRNA uridine-5-carboxymethylaminomethyl(34) synthesis GTPase MnmE [Planctomycetota bacterium]|nr:MAG: tRNA uridine-5-carboxymethylaminomethyl(34) synthesis GTPase MnmE [Planctomycetota bacterium]